MELLPEFRKFLVRQRASAIVLVNQEHNISGTPHHAGNVGECFGGLTLVRITPIAVIPEQEFLVRFPD